MQNAEFTGVSPEFVFNTLHLMGGKNAIIYFSPDVSTHFMHEYTEGEPDSVDLFGN